MSCTSSLERRDTALPEELIALTLAKVEIALHHGNEEEAHTVIARAFSEAQAKEQVTLDSPLIALGLPVRTVNGMEEAGILTVGDLCDWRLCDLISLPNFGERTAHEVRAAIERHGFRFMHGNKRLTGTLA
jgi:DNA-directed RNA polymerase alpha subunit